MGMSRQGLLIAVEGIDGTGKSTQVRLLTADLSARGYAVVQTREPTDGPYGRRLRASFASRHQLTPAVELELFMDDRRQHVREVIAPALAAGKIVVTDRYYLSTAAYQGAQGMEPEAIIAANEAFAPRPDLVLLLTLPPAEGIRRIRELRGDALNDFEQADNLARVARIFGGLAGDHIARLDADGSLEQVRQRIAARVAELLAAKNYTPATEKEQYD